jgi:DNA-binding NarL/FixJ family response regulator
VIAPLRVAVGEDDVLLREGIARVLTDAGFEVVAEAGDADDLLRKGLAHAGPARGGHQHAARAAATTAARPPRGPAAAAGDGVLVLSQYYEERYAADLLADGADGVGYLLKERVGRVEEFVDAATRVAEGGSAIDPEVVARMLGRRRKRSGTSTSSAPRELEVMGVMAEGKSNRGIADALVISVPAVEKHITRIFGKLEIDAVESEHRRVHAVLTYLRES